MKRGRVLGSAFVFEHHKQPLLPRAAYLRRVIGHATIAFIIIFGSLALGVCGYHYFEHLPWLDSLLNASMILGGMGQVDPIRTAGGKLFASFYALYSGMAFLVVAGLLFAPVVHRLLHSLHFERDDDPSR